MSRQLKYIVPAFCFITLVTLVYAADKDFWSAKPYTQWSEKEVDKLLKNSPWAKEITLSSALAGMAGGEGGGMGAGGDVGDTGGGGGGGRRGGGGGGSNPEAGRGSSISSFVVRWYALPVREALAQRFLLGPEPSKETLDKLLKFNSPYYSLLIEGLPLGGGRGRGRGGEAAQQLRQETVLRKKNKEKIPLVDVLMPTSRGQALVLRFAKEQDGRPTLALDDKEVELIIKVQDNTYHVKFKLADMVIKSQLEL
jgi:hypothetical protein